MPRRLSRRAFLGGALLVFLGVRLSVLLTSSRILFYWEETVPLVVAEQMLGGLRLPFVEYQSTHYQGGPIVTALLAMPLVHFAGPSLLALKLIPLAFAAGALGLWLHILWVHLGPLVATTFALLYTLAPPTFVLFNLVAFASHPETVLVSAVLLGLATRLLTGPQEGRARDGFLFGAASGLGLWYDYATGETLAVLVPLLVIVRPALIRAIPAFAVGTLVGLLPWIHYNATHGFLGIEKLREVFVAGVEHPFQGGDWGERLRTASLELTGFREVGPVSATLQVILYASATTLALAGAVIAAVRWPRGPRHAAGFLVVTAALALPVVALAAYFVSDVWRQMWPVQYPVRARVVVFAYPFALAAVAVGLVTTFARLGAGRLVGVLAATALAMSGLAAWASLLGAGPAQKTGAELRDTGCLAFGFYAMLKYPHDAARAGHNVAALRGGRCRAQAFVGYGWGALDVLALRGQPERAVEAIGLLPMPWRWKAFEGFMFQTGLYERVVSERAAPRAAEHLALLARLRAHAACCMEHWPPSKDLTILPQGRPCGCKLSAAGMPPRYARRGGWSAAVTTQPTVRTRAPCAA